MDSSRDREAFLRCRRECYRLQRERENVEEREVRLARRREYYRRRRAIISTEQREAIFYSREEQLQQTRHGQLQMKMQPAVKCPFLQLRESSLPIQRLLYR